MFKLLLIAALVAAANAYLNHPGYGAPATLGYGAPTYYGGYGHAVAAPAITSQHSNILRSYGNLGAVSTYSKSIDTPYSSVRKSDIRVNNPGYAVGPTYAPSIAHAPIAYASPAYASHGLLGVAYSAAPAVAHMAYSNPVGLHYGW